MKRVSGAKNACLHIYVLVVVGYEYIIKFNKKIYIQYIPRLKNRLNQI
jgi:hypothetical protein